MISKGLIKTVSNIPGWKTKRKILVFESDDWGSTRIPSKEALKELDTRGIIGGREPFNMYENLASREDLEILFDTLRSYSDINGNSCVFTAACIMANPDFEKIEKSGFNEYHYELFTESLDRYYPAGNVFSMWKDGISGGLFVPQFHGREHLNIAEWMRALKDGDEATHTGFRNRIWAFTRRANNPLSIPYTSAFDFYYPDDVKVHKEVIRDGLALFEQVFGYKPEFFIPPNGPLSSELESITSEMGVKFISRAKMHKEPAGYGKNRYSLNWLGKTNRYGQRYLTRNCIFEPIFQGKDWVASCLNDIENAFTMRKPAIISSHRANYIGTIDNTNRENGISQLNMLLGRALKRWPDLEFFSSTELGSLINSN